MRDGRPNATPDVSDGSQPHDRGLAFGESIAAGGCIALLGSLLLAAAECLLVAGLVSKRLSGETIPTDLLVALIGRAALTHTLFWLPIMIVLAAGYWSIRRRRAAGEPIRVLAAAFVVLAGGVVASADLELAGRTQPVLLAGAWIVAAALGAATYLAVRLMGQKAGRARLIRLVHILTVLALLFTAAAVVGFARSPLFDPASWQVPASSSQHARHSRPNVLWIVLDTARADRMSCHGYAQPTTPFLDEWSREVVMCALAISNGMWTVPAHASMFTGLSVREHGSGHRHLWLDDSFRTLADALATGGYATTMFSNNPLVSPDTNLTKGFQDWRIVYHWRQLNRFSLDYLCEKWGITPFLPWLDQDYGAALTNRFVAQWLDAHADVPKFVFINYMETHLPYRVPKRYRRMFLDADQVDRSYDLRRRVFGDAVRRLDRDFNIEGSDFLSASDRQVLQGQYDAAIRYLDERVREVVEMFAQRGLLDNTLVVITSDHGEHLGTQGMWGHRFLTYQDLAHVTLQIREPQRQRGARISTPVQLSDLYATVLNATLGQPNANESSRACDLLVLAERGGEPRVAICECNGPAPMNLKWFENRTEAAVLHRMTPQIAAVDQRFKLIRSADGRRELYDLLADPGELHNLIDQRPDEAERLDACIRAWLEATPAYAPPADESPTPDVLKSLRSLGYVGDDD